MVECLVKQKWIWVQAVNVNQIKDDSVRWFQKIDSLVITECGRHGQYDFWNRNYWKIIFEGNKLRDNTFRIKVCLCITIIGVLFMHSDFILKEQLLYLKKFEITLFELWRWLFNLLGGIRLLGSLACQSTWVKVYWMGC